MSCRVLGQILPYLLTTDIDKEDEGDELPYNTRPIVYSPKLMRPLLIGQPAYRFKEQAKNSIPNFFLLSN